MRLTGTIFAAAILLALSGCVKYDPECELVVKPRALVARDSDEAASAAYMARVYVYYNVGRFEKDLLEWSPESYADADAGIIRNKRTGEVRSHSLVGTQSDEVPDYPVHLRLSSSPVVLVAVDPINRFYAWRSFEFELPIERIIIPVKFQLWRTNEQYKDSEWSVASEAYDNRPPESETE